MTHKPAASGDKDVSASQRPPGQAQTLATELRADDGAHDQIETGVAITADADGHLDVGAFKTRDQYG